MLQKLLELGLQLRRFHGGGGPRARQDGGQLGEEPQQVLAAVQLGRRHPRVQRHCLQVLRALFGVQQRHWKRSVEV